MYSWGPDTSDWKKPSKHKFDSARKPYLDKLAADASARGPRSYARRSSPDMKLVDAHGKEISSDSTNPIVVAVDVTGSMQSWPGEIFDRLPLLYQTLSQYRPDVEICFAAIGDATCDSWPLQVNNFGKGVSLEDNIKALCPEGGGGGHITESYELFAHFMNTHCKTPKATTPFLIVFGDEAFYDQVEPSQVKHYIGDTLQKPIETSQVWKELMQKFNVFFLQKPYGSSDSSTTAEVKKYWADALGKQRVIDLPSCDRAVDVAMGLVAKQWGQFGDFKSSMGARHDSSEAAPVYDSLRYVDSDPTSKSVMKSKRHSAKTLPLDKLADDKGDAP